MSVPEPPAQTGEPVIPGAAGGEDQLPAPASPAPADLQDLLWQRISAALIDLAVLLGVFFVLSVATGGASWDQGPSFYLTGGAAILFLALVLGYYFALEAAFGQTVGKYLLGLRVVRPDGSRPSTSAITVRTVLRIVDWLPLLYLVGFITMLATGTRRPRLGDLAARTRVDEREAPARHRGILATLMTVVLLLVVGVAVQQAADSNQGSHVRDGTYRGHGVSFDYPAGWQELPKFQAGGDEQWSAAVAAADLDLVVVAAYAPYGPVTAENLNTAKSDFEGRVQQAAEQTGGTVLAGPEEITVAGKPGLWFRLTGTHDGTPYESRLVFVFDGTTEYAINCQHTAENADEIERGCDQIIRTFTVNP
jgi:uncharacterized RDD family membrane protein YckC